MSKSHSPEQHFSEEPNREKLAPPVAPEQSEHDGPSQPEVDEDVILGEMELYDKKRFRAVQKAELELERVFADDPEPLYKKHHLTVKKEDIPRWRVIDLLSALIDLHEFKDQLPKRYKANIEKIIENAEFVRKMFDDYRSWGKEKGFKSFFINDGLIDLAGVLWKTDPEHFSFRDLMGELSDEEFKALTYHTSRALGEGLLKTARMAEFDPDRFRRLFANEYTPEKMAENRAYWARFDKRDESHFLEAWEIIEHALQEEVQQADTL